ncbi:hypothetical protein [Deminuibacter soli]|nr:hypothetical protein [Deminuibacter soli]
MKKRLFDYERVRLEIESCKTPGQLSIALQKVNLFAQKYPGSDLSESLLDMVAEGLKKIKQENEKYAIIDG